MSYEEQLRSISLPADGDQTGNQYRFLKGDTDGVAVNDAAGGPCIGVLQNKPDDGQVATVGIDGVSMVEAGGTVTKYGNVQSDATGRAADAAAGDYSQGMALAAAAGAGEIIPVLLRPQAQLN
jgi:hypothetical protein